MASTRSKVEAEAISLDAFGRDVQRRREAAGNIQIPRNTGSRRTESKRALLKAIKSVGGNW
jgi:hypothetical protein